MCATQEIERTLGKVKINVPPRGTGFKASFRRKLTDVSVFREIPTVWWRETGAEKISLLPLFNY